MIYISIKILEQCQSDIARIAPRKIVIVHNTLTKYMTILLGIKLLHLFTLYYYITNFNITAIQQHLSEKTEECAY